MGIGSWGNRATRKFAKGDRGHLPPELAAKIDDVLKRLSRDASPASLREDGYQIHRLTGDRKSAHAIAISRRYRVVFRFEDGNAYDIRSGRLPSELREDTGMEPEIDRADPDPPPELYTIDGAVSAEVLKARYEWLCRNPSHPGQDIARTCERKSLSVPEAAVLFGVECADLTAVIEGRAPVTVDLALRIEAAGWSRAEGWLQWQSEYDLAQERRRRERTGSVPAPRARATDPVATAS